jgi:phosphoglycerate dehydrogenase-like enzyme
MAVGPKIPAPFSVVVADANFVPVRDLFAGLLPPEIGVTWHPAFDEAKVLPDLAAADVFVGPRFTAAMGAAAPRLKLVHVGGAGYDGIDFAALPAGAVCANTFNHEASIAEYIVATTIVMRRRLLFMDHALRAAHWASSVYEPERPQFSTLEGATVGIVGFGHIGRRAWGLMRAFGARGVAVTAHPGDAAAEGLDWIGGWGDLGRLLETSDVVVLCLPLKPETRHMIAAAELAAMKPDAILVNVSRGPLVDPVALHAALSDNRIGGAVIDVWYNYPKGTAHAAPADVDFSSLGNVMMTPHVSGVTRQTFEGRARDIADNIRRLIDGQPLRNVVHAG